MTLESIVLNNLRRRKGRMIFLVLGLLIGVATVVTLISLANALTADVQHKMENYGANILITPRSDDLSLSYGGITLGGVSVDSREIRQADLAKIMTIPNNRNIAAVAPKVLGAVEMMVKFSIETGASSSALPIASVVSSIISLATGVGLGAACCAHAVNKLNTINITSTATIVFFISFLLMFF